MFAAGAADGRAPADHPGHFERSRRAWTPI
jgi:hypothetical protein